jgi:hypothetical protein
MIKKVIPEMPFQAGSGGFKVPRGYRFVRSLPNQFGSEYYLFPFHWPARFYWRAIHGSTSRLHRLVRWMYKRGWFTINGRGGILTWPQLIKYIWRNRTYAKKKRIHKKI